MMRLDTTRLRRWRESRYEILSAELAGQHLLIDTGADATLIPQAALAPLGLQPIADVTYELIAFDGTRSVASVADLDLIFLNRRFRSRYLLTDEDSGVFRPRYPEPLGARF